ncbi:MAG: hypothetical protein HN878_02605 [Candidatus Diapherotrites archaeon]|nr:hypothetical protein [Candidatus Diapherotrites archaeon]
MDELKEKKVRETKKLVWDMLDCGKSCEQISKELNLDLGTRFEKETVKWYSFCKMAKKNQSKAFEKHGSELYSRAGKAAQKKHPWIGHELGKKYASIIGKKRMGDLRDSGELSNYFSNAAKKLHEKFPEHSRNNMKKAHKTMKENGVFGLHQRNAALACMKKRPNHLKKMSKIAHSKYNLVELSRISRRKNSPFEFMGCFFDSNQEREVCKKLIENDLIKTPMPGKNIHFKIKNYEIDFFIDNKIFLEFHPPVFWGYKKETKESYCIERKKVVSESDYAKCPLFIISHIKETQEVLDKIKSLL